MIFDQLRRRDFIMMLGGAAALGWPIGARAQQTPQVPRIGFVYPGSKAAAPSRIEAILSGLRVSGYAAPAQVELVVRTAEGDPAQITTLVTEVMATTVNVFIANGPAVLNAARSATRTIPIVAIDLETDPVASGAAASLARPGGNITGVFLDFPNFTARAVSGLLESGDSLRPTDARVYRY
jgi:putative ABC transport system substrate-binding protein